MPRQNFHSLGFCCYLALVAQKQVVHRGNLTYKVKLRVNLTSENKMTCKVDIIDSIAQINIGVYDIPKQSFTVFRIISNIATQQRYLLHHVRVVTK